MARNTLLNDDQDNAQALEHARNEGFTAGRTEGFAAGHAEGLAAGRAEAAAAAQQAADSERQRINSIVNDPRCAGNLAAALAMATEFPGATADQVAGMVGRFAPAAPAAPAAEQRPPQPPNQNPYGSLQQRTAATGVNQVGAVPPAAAAVPGEAEAQKLWGDTIAAENKRRTAMADKRGGRH